ncbi:MAG: hypothetical protein K0U98_24275 [Deltaproteobacteria bacterium]|nr:hypothetical protein [Deltaproteobacteria bacterium]
MNQEKKQVEPLSVRALWSLLALSMVLTGLAFPTEAKAAAGEGMSIESVEISTLTFQKPVQRMDADGKNQTYREAIRLLFTGEFPPATAEPYELFIGDYQVMEYSGSRSELQVILFEEGLMDRLEGSELRYRSPQGESRALGVAFHRDGIRPVSPPSPDN